MPEVYLAELAEIVAGGPTLPVVENRDPRSHDWLRRSEFDTGSLQAWEQPDGTIVAVLVASGKRLPQPY
jgi:hypothetical protein